MLHLGHEQLVTGAQRGELPDPPPRLGMRRVPAMPEHEDVPQPVKLAMLAEQMLPAERSWCYVPDTHVRKLARGAHSLHVPQSTDVETSRVKILLVSDSAVRIENDGGAPSMTIEADTPERSYSPFHMLGSALGVCTYSVLHSWAKHAGVSADALLVDVSWEFGEKPHRVSAMRVSFTWPGLPAERRAVASRVASLCAIHATLSHSPTIAIEFAP